MRRARAALAAALTWLISGAGAAQGDELGLRLECQRRAEPGRVLCEAELEVERGRLSWADVLVVEAPGFAPPLRARVGPDGVVMQSEQRQRLQFALAATAEGQGTLRVRARAVHCPEDARRHCVPVSRVIATDVAVGPIRSPATPDN